MIESSDSSKEESADDRETGEPGEDSIPIEELGKGWRDDCGGLRGGIKAEKFEEGRFSRE